MTFTPWMRILESEEAKPSTPHAYFDSRWTRYHAVWQAPSWRYDRATGEVEYRGLCKVKDGNSVAASYQQVIVWCQMPETPALPRPSALQMCPSMSSYGVGTNETTRIDIGAWAGGHHWLALEATSSTGTAIGAGNWFWLGHVKLSLSNRNPTFGPWARNYNTYGETCHGAYFNLYTGQFIDYPGWMPAQFRVTPDLKRWQWRGLIQNTLGALGQSSPYVNVIDVAHPAPYVPVGNVLNTMIGHFNWQGGQVGSLRIDAQPHSYGHRLHLVGSKAAANNYIALNLDYMIRL